MFVYCFFFVCLFVFFFSMKCGLLRLILYGVILTFQAPTPQNGQTHSENSSAFADKLFEPGDELFDCV